MNKSTKYTELALFLNRMMLAIVLGSMIADAINL